MGGQIAIQVWMTSLATMHWFNWTNSLIHPTNSSVNSSPVWIGPYWKQLPCLLSHEHTNLTPFAFERNSLQEISRQRGNIVSVPRSFCTFWLGGERSWRGTDDFCLFPNEGKEWHWHACYCVFSVVACCKHFQRDTYVDKMVSTDKDPPSKQTMSPFNLCVENHISDVISTVGFQPSQNITKTLAGMSTAILKSKKRGIKSRTTPGNIYQLFFGP